MTERKIGNPEWFKLPEKLTAKIQLVELHTPDLGVWEVFRWEVFENGGFVERGSITAGREYCCPRDVLDQLEYQFIDKHHLEPVFGVESWDADPGL